MRSIHPSRTTIAPQVKFHKEITNEQVKRGVPIWESDRSQNTGAYMSTRRLYVVVAHGGRDLKCQRWGVVIWVLMPQVFSILHTSPLMPVIMKESTVRTVGNNEDLVEGEVTAWEMAINQAETWLTDGCDSPATRFGQGQTSRAPPYTLDFVGQNRQSNDTYGDDSQGPSLSGRYHPLDHQTD